MNGSGIYVRVHLKFVYFLIIYDFKSIVCAFFILIVYVVRSLSYP